MNNILKKLLIIFITLTMLVGCNNQKKLKEDELIEDMATVMFDIYGRLEFEKLSKLYVEQSDIEKAQKEDRAHFRNILFTLTGVEFEENNANEIYKALLNKLDKLKMEIKILDTDSKDVKIVKYIFNYVDLLKAMQKAIETTNNKVKEANENINTLIVKSMMKEIENIIPTIKTIEIEVKFRKIDDEWQIDDMSKFINEITSKVLGIGISN